MEMSSDTGTRETNIHFLRSNDLRSLCYLLEGPSDDAKSQRGSERKQHPSLAAC